MATDGARKEHEHDYIGMLQKYQTLERRAWDGSKYHNITLEHEALAIFCSTCGDSKQMLAPIPTQTGGGE